MTSCLPSRMAQNEWPWFILRGPEVLRSHRRGRGRRFTTALINGSFSACKPITTNSPPNNPPQLPHRSAVRLASPSPCLSLFFPAPNILRTTLSKTATRSATVYVQKYTHKQPGRFPQNPAPPLPLRTLETRAQPVGSACANTRTQLRIRIHKKLVLLSPSEKFAAQQIHFKPPFRNKITNLRHQPRTTPSPQAPTPSPQINFAENGHHSC